MNIAKNPQFPRVDSKYGAPMGRWTGHHHYEGAPCRVFRVKLDQGGYDQGGAYFGTDTWGARLYCVQGEGLQLFYRVGDRDDAKAAARTQVPNIRFLN